MENNLLFDITPVTTNHTRICAVRFCINDKSLLLCCVYKPNQSVSLNEYMESLNCLITLKELYAPDTFLIGGDFNVDLHKSSLHKKSMQFVLLPQNLSSCYNLRCCEINYTFESKRNSCKSFIDIFVFNIPFVILLNVMCYMMEIIFQITFKYMLSWIYPY